MRTSNLILTLSVLLLLVGCTTTVSDNDTVILGNPDQVDDVITRENTVIVENRTTIINNTQTNNVTSIQTDNNTNRTDVVNTVIITRTQSPDIYGSIDKSRTRGIEVQYGEGMQGYLVQPRAAGSFPAIILIHEWWGLTDEVKNAAHLLAQQGYIVLAVDLYNGNVTNDPAVAAQLSSGADKTAMIENLRSARIYLDNMDTVERVGVFGWCFGGGQSLAISVDSDFDATVIYYGTPLITDADTLSKINGPVLGIFGQNDTVIAPSQVQQFKKALDDAGVENEVYIYPDVGHAFANPTGDNYARPQTADAWEKTLAFLNKNLKK